MGSDANAKISRVTHEIRHSGTSPLLIRHRADSSSSSHSTVQVALGATFREAWQNHARISGVGEVEEDQRCTPADSENHLGPPHESSNPVAYEEMRKG